MICLAALIRISSKHNKSSDMKQAIKTLFRTTCIVTVILHGMGGEFDYRNLGNNCDTIS
jgi:hypothetical protein